MEVVLKLNHSQQSNRARNQLNPLDLMYIFTQINLKLPSKFGDEGDDLSSRNHCSTKNEKRIAAFPPLRE